MKSLTQIYLILLALLLMLAGCNNSSQPSQDSRATSSPNSLPPTNTPFLEPSTMTPVPTSTLHPTLSAEGAYELVLQLLEDNSNCQLPCWWGITPSVTRSQDAISFLNSFSPVIAGSSMRIDRGGMRLQIPNGDGLLSTSIEYNSIDGIVDSLRIGVSQLVQNENGGYDDVHGDPDFARATQALMLPEILKTYGQPKEVLISTYSLQPLGWPVFFDIQLFYPEHGFLMVYHTLMEFSHDEYIKGCPSNSAISIGLWEAGKYSSVNDVPRNIRDNISIFSLSSYLPLNEATDMSIQDFYDAFSDDEELCLETPSSLWPFPGQ
jgi:hypothetical protein